MAYSIAGDRRELLATYLAYERLMRAVWPTMRSEAELPRPIKAPTTEDGLRTLMNRLLRTTDTSPLKVRVFWKLLPEYSYRGINQLFVQDAGRTSVEELLGQNDFSSVVPWNRQAALYRKDDESVATTRTEKLNIIERQDQPTGTIFLRTAKVPTIASDGQVIGLMGAYELIDAATALKFMRT